MITGQLEADTGDLDLPGDITISHMEQEISTINLPAHEFVLMGDEVYYQTQQAIAAAQAADQHEKLSSLFEKLDDINGYTAPARAEQIMAGLGFTEEEFQNPVASFSGGWRIRLNLARCLMSPADLLLLDEPTNHLDLDAILWLSNWLSGFRGTLLLISHDREFLDETVSHIAHLDQKQITLYSGNYSRFEILRAAKLAEQTANFQKQQREVKAMEAFVRRFRYKATKARQAQSRLKALERMKLIAPAHIDSPFHFSIPNAERISDPLLVMDKTSLGYDTAVLKEVNFSIHPGDRIGLLGQNGAGKSTLVKALAQELPLLGGEIVPGVNLATGYFSQHQMDTLDLHSSAARHLARLDPALSDQQIRDFLGQYNFHGDKVFDSVSQFSGGEKARLSLALITYQKPNLLLMDEPTNHLDMDMRQALTVALQDFAGAMIIISHDRHLLNNTVDRFLLVQEGQVVEYDGDLNTYRDSVFGRSPGSSDKPAAIIEPPTEPDEGKAKSAAGQSIKGRTSHKESQQLKTRIRTLEGRIERLQDKLKDVETSLYDNKLYQEGEQDDLQNLLREQLSLAAQIETLESEWIEKSERLEQLQSLN